MAFIGNKELSKILSASPIITEYSADRISNGAYELSLGDEVFQTDASPKAVKKLKDNDIIEIKPGQFALLLTKEVITMPKNKIAFISIKAGVKFKGLVNVSGFHVDPGFKGKLLFSVYNAGPSSIFLTRGKAYFPIWFAELSESQDYKGSHGQQMHIPDAPIEALSQGELASPNELSKRINNFNTDMDKRLSVLERDQKANNYIAVTSVSLFVVIFVKFIFDWSVFTTGIEKGVMLKTQELTADSVAKSSNRETVRLHSELDSIRHALNELIEQNKKHGK
ncbi:dCTP deaminase [Chitinophaga sp. W3I9]|uniref:dCTP deaminase domain-containing protein n=1 Tax=Chitinophaga sp. W3I9 TaxID=3373924 RepID=UPI003D20B577